MEDIEYYEVLGISKNASDSDIKRAYHKCAQLYHPDKNDGCKVAEEKFKKCCEAYEVLSDNNKKSLYDKYGKKGLSQNNGMNDMFGNVFGNAFGTNTRINKTKDVMFNVEVTLKELYDGCIKELKYTRHIICNTCGGKGTCNNIDIKCKNCDGQGQKIKTIRNGNMIYQTLQPCEHCLGKGYHINDIDKCLTCQGNKLIIENKILNIVIDKGSTWGDHIRMFGESNQSPNIVTGDIIVILLKNNKQIDEFERIGDDLMCEKTITFIQSITGKNIIVNHISGKDLLIDSQLIQPGSVKKISMYGMPIKDKHNQYGDLYIKFKVIYDFTPKQIEKMVELLPTESLIIPTSTISCVLDDITTLPSHQESVNTDQNTDENNVQCAQQ